MKVEDFMNKRLPGDITLGQCRRYMLTTPEMKSLARHFIGGITIKCWGPDGHECSDDLTLGQFRRMADQGEAHITVEASSGDGGLRVKEDA
jgi:hypothetical protein